jgi:Glycosyl transferase family 2.
MNIATGDLIAMLDSDDSWSPSYLADLVPHALKHGAAYGQTVIQMDFGKELRRIPELNIDKISFDVFKTAFGSLHGIALRDLSPEFRSYFFDDVLWDMELLSAVGGTAPFVASSKYFLRIRPGSVTGGGAPQTIAEDDYNRVISYIEAGEYSFRKGDYKRASEVFRLWRAVNRAYSNAMINGSQISYHDFLTSLRHELGANFEREILSRHDD